MSDTALPQPLQSLRIAVVYALPDQQVIVNLLLPADSTVSTAVECSQLRRRFAQIAQGPMHCAVFGQAVAMGAKLHDGDRVEILRPLLIDPKESRRQAAHAQKKR